MSIGVPNTWRAFAVRIGSIVVCLHVGFAGAYQPAIDMGQAIANADAEGIEHVLEEDPGQIWRLTWPVERWTGNSCLHLAARAGQVDFARFLLSKGAPVNVTNDSEETPLHIAAVAGQPEMVELLIAKGADVGAKERNGATALHLAARAGHVDVLRLLLKSGAAVSGKDHLGRTPLEYALEPIVRQQAASILVAAGAHYGILEASAMGDVEFVKKALAENPALVGTRDPFLGTALHCAARVGQTEVLQLLLRKSPFGNVDDRTAYGETPLHVAALERRLQAADLLVQKGADVKARTVRGETPLHMAAKGGLAAIVELLLSKGADIDARDSEEETPLHEASAGGHREAVETLLANGASIDVQEEEGATPLHLAAAAGHVETAALLLLHHAQVNSADHGAQTPLHYAAQAGFADVVKLLLANGADVRGASGFQRQQEGYETPLWRLVWCAGKAQIARMLLDRGADPDESYGWFDLLGLAAWNKDPEMVRALVEAGANVNAANQDGLTALHFAARTGCAEAARVLLDAGANPLARGRFGPLFTPVDEAIGDENWRVLAVLLGDARVRTDQEESGWQILLTEIGSRQTAAEQAVLSTVADSKLRDEQSLTSLHAAAARGQADLAQTLLKWGADVEALDAKGRVPLHYAAEEGHTSVAEVLVEHGAKVNSKDQDGWTPLALAERAGKEAVAAFLRRCGGVQ
jgi:ankyrin repeat protein